MSVRLAAILALSATVFLAATPAQALKVRNLDDYAHTVVLHDCGEVTRVTIEPGRFYWRMGQCITLQMEGGEEKVRTRTHEEYMIKNGSLFLQKRNNKGSRN